MTDFETVLDRFENRRKRDSSPATVDRYARHVRNWREWLSQNRNKTLWNAGAVDLRVFIEEQTDDGMAPTTISQRVSAISKFYQDCGKMADRYEMPEVPENPYEGLDKTDKKLLRGNTKKKDGLKDTDTDEYPYLEPEKIAELVENVPAPRLRNELIIKLLFNCGFRRGELAKAKVEHIDREDRSVYIPPRKSTDGRHVAYNKNYLGFQLDRWLDHGNRESMTYAPESDYLFPTNDSEHISGDYINQMVKETARNAGLQETINKYADGRNIHKVTAHTLRHSFAMQALNSGVDIRKLQTLLGHDELDTTLIYLQQSKEEAKEQSRAFQPDV
jgi:integrase/recombinase XerD